MLIILLKSILAKLQKQFKNLFTFKKLMFLASITLLYYRSKSLPLVISSSDFLNFLNSKSCNISYMEIFLNKFILFKSQNVNYYTTHLISNDETFSKLLISKNIHFNYIVDEIQALLLNPHNQFMVLTGIAGYFLLDIAKNSFLNYSKKKNHSIPLNATNDEYLNNFIAKPVIKNKLCFFIDQIRNQEKFKSKGLKVARGLLLYGPPGTGKTLIARCLAKVHNINFICKCASEFVEIYVGSGAKAIRDTFREAQENKPCIIFIDELEAIGFQRSSTSFDYSNNLERYTALNQLLSEMDGLNENDEIIVVGATNRFDLLDDALVRQGRFSMKVFVDLPAEEERKLMFKHYFKILHYDVFSEEKLVKFSRMCPGFSGADIEGVVNEAISKSVSENVNDVTEENIVSLIKYFAKQKGDHRGNNNLIVD